MIRPGLVLLLLAACTGDDPTASATATTDTSATTSPTSTSTSTSTDTTTTTGDAPTTTAPITTSTDPTSPTDPSTSGDATGEPASTGTTGGGDACACAPDNERIVVLSDDGELWAYQPGTDAFEHLADVICPGVQKPYSLAVDRRGVAWIQYTSDGQVYTFDPADPAPCQFAGVIARPAGFDFFGLSFAPESLRDPCERLFLFNYDGQGVFSEGPGVGALGVFDPATEVVTKIGPTDYDGGELAGTGDGRLFAFAGEGPAKLIEYDKASAQVLSILPLPGVHKTRASAFAFHGGDAFFFTEAVDATCFPCLAASCPADFAACQADPVCDEALVCSIELGDIQDDCGGLMPQAMTDCAVQTCADACYPATADIVSRVIRLDHDGSDGNGQALAVVVPQAPIRIVGAAASTCAPYLPQ